jgi:hypothetical protein
MGSSTTFKVSGEQTTDWGEGLAVRLHLPVRGVKKNSKGGREGDGTIPGFFHLLHRKK